MRVDYLRPGPPEDVEIESRVVRAGNRVSVVNTSVCVAGSSEDILAEGRAVYNTRKARQD
jgi:acyl-coenzyme A thioesterase PaaI-like protein